MQKPKEEALKQFFQSEKKRFEAHVHYLYFPATIPNNLSIQKILPINKDDLNSCGKKTIQLFDSEEESELSNAFRDLKFKILAWFEIQDILEYQFSPTLLDDDSKSTLDKFLPIFAKPYCYFEASRLLKEGFMAGTNGYFNCSLASLRSFIELATIHIYFKKQEEENREGFESWIREQKGHPPFRTLLDYIFEHEGGINFLRDRIVSSYDLTSIYAHKPRPSESFTLMRRSTGLLPSLDALAYWVMATAHVLRSLLCLYAANYPMCFFPVDIIKKFGFRGPLGVFFNESNYAVISKGIENEDIVLLKNTFCVHPDVTARLNWYSALPILTDADLEKEWMACVIGYGLSKEVAAITDNNHRYSALQARTRAQMALLLYHYVEKIAKEKLENLRALIN